MTLVVAHCTPLGVRLSADMRVTDRDAVRHGFLCAQLKLVLVSPMLCIAYAGAAGLAITAIRRVHESRFDFGDAVSYLLDVHVRAGRRTDFIVAGLQPTSLVAIKDGAAKESHSGWLGDSLALNEYKHNYDRQSTLLPASAYPSAEYAADIDIASRMSAGMRAVISGAHTDQDGNLTIPSGGVHETVGEAAVFAHPRIAHGGLFGYGFYRSAESSGFAPPLKPDLGVVPPDFGSAERGAFSYFVLTPTDPGIGAVGIYFVEGSLGVLYAPLLLDEPASVAKVSLKDFVNAVEDDYGIRLDG